MIYLLSLTLPFWFEWKFTYLSSISLGLVDIIVVSFLFKIALMTKNSNSLKKAKVPCIKLVYAFTFFMIIPLLLDDAKPLKVIWASYKIISFNLLYFLVYYEVKDFDGLQKIIRFILISSSIAAIIGILQTITGHPIDFLSFGKFANEIKRNASYWLPRAWGTLRSPNEFAGFLIWPISISVGLFIVSTGKRKLLLIAILLQTTALIFTQSRAGLIGLILSLSIIVYLLKYKKAIYFAILGIVLILAIHIFFPKVDLIPGDLSGRIRSIFVEGTKADAMSPRYLRWKYFFDTAIKNPFGKKILSEEELMNAGLYYAQTPHNTFLHLALKAGFGGLIVATLLFCTLLKSSFDLAKKLKNKYYIGLTTGIFGGGIGFLFHSFFEVLWTQWQTGELVWFMLGITMVIKAKNLEITKKPKEMK